jgi:hypothetical protein
MQAELTAESRLLRILPLRFTLRSKGLNKDIQELGEEHSVTQNLRKQLLNLE